VSWDEALTYAASEFRRIQAKHGVDSIGGITSSRCTNEETYLVQKLVRAAFGNNNVDTCARVCHSPTGYGLKATLGESAGTQTFASVDKADVIIVIGANPTDGHPVFASRLKRRVREGAQLVVVDPRRIDLVNTPHVRASHHLQLKPGTNVAVVNALAHVIVTEGLVKEDFVAERCEPRAFQQWRDFVSMEENSPEAMEAITGVPAHAVREAARLYANAATGLNSATGRPSFRNRTTFRKRWLKFPACRLRPFAGPPGFTPTAATVRSITVLASPSTHRVRPR
jgi:formate dehydrogenase major subunit